MEVLVKNETFDYSNTNYYEPLIGLGFGFLFLFVVFFAATNKDTVGIPKFANETSRNNSLAVIFSDSNLEKTHLFNSPVVLEQYTVGYSFASVDISLPVINIPEAHYDSATKTFYHEHDGNRF